MGGSGGRNASLFLSRSLSLSIAISVSLNVRLYVCLSGRLSVYPIMSLYLSLSLFLFFYVSLYKGNPLAPDCHRQQRGGWWEAQAGARRLSLSLYPSLSIPLSLSLCRYLCLSVCLSVSLLPTLSLSVFLSLSLSTMHPWYLIAVGNSEEVGGRLRREERVSPLSLAV